MSGEPRKTIKGKDHWLYVARLSHDPNTGRPILEVIQDEDIVLLKSGDEFVTLWAGCELAPVMPVFPKDAES